MESLIDQLNAEYRAHVDRLVAEHPLERAMAIAIGGSFEAIGAIEVGVLRGAGLEPGWDVIDIGCGSGRLAAALERAGHHGSYLGVDVVPALVDYARSTRPARYRFEVTDGLSVPAGDASADLACMFSLITHLPLEATFLLLRECTRVLRPGGTAVVSFLEFAVPTHLAVFAQSVDSFRTARHHNQFVHADDLAHVAGLAGLRFVSVHPGHTTPVEIDGTYVDDDGNEVVNPAVLGQSWMVLEVPPA